MQPLEAEDPSTIGPYRLVARLGAGGMGRVYLARNAGGRTVAVKVVRAELADDPDFRDRFRREVAAAQSVDGPYTAPVVEADRNSATPWLATVYVLGPSLTEAVVAHGPLPEKSVRALGAVLAEALAAIHAAGLVHRDLKPSNVLLAADGPRVIDFGIARALDGAGATLTSTGVVVGSPGFMSPEQAAGTKVGPAGDVFSLGAVLAFAATGQGPFGQASVASLLHRVVHEQPDLERVPASLRDTIGRCLAKTPEDRPTPAQLLALLAPEGAAALLRGAWLPAEVASGIAQHAAHVMELETPAPVAPDSRATQGPQEPQEPQVASDPQQAETVALGAGAASSSGPSRRGLLYGALGFAVAVAGSGTAIALLNKGPGRGTAGGDAKAPTSAASPAPVQSRPPGVAPAPTWTYTATHSIDSPPLYTRAGLLVPDQNLVALDPRSGDKRWTGPLLAPSAYQNPFASTGDLLIAAPTDQLHALAGIDPDTGGQKWLWQVPSQYGIDRVLGADDRTAFLATTASNGDSVVIAVDLRARSIRWLQKRQVTSGAGNFIMGLATDKYLVYTNDNNHVVVRDTTTGEQLWTGTYGLAGAPSPQLPLLVGDTLYLTGDQLIGYGLAKGEHRMSSANISIGGMSGFGAVAYGDGALYCTAGDGVVALDARTGRQIWQSDVHDVNSGQLLVVQNTVFAPVFLDHKPAIAALDRASGRRLWTFTDAGDISEDWQLATDGTTLYAAHDTHVYALPSR